MALDQPELDERIEQVAGEQAGGNVPGRPGLLGRVGEGVGQGNFGEQVGRRAPTLDRPLAEAAVREGVGELGVT